MHQGSKWSRAMGLKSTCSIYLGEAVIRKDTCTPMFIAALFTTAKTWRQPKCPSTEEWIKEMYVCTMEYYSAMKRNEIMPFAATWMDLKIIILSEVSQTKTNIIWGHSYVESNFLKKRTKRNELIYKTETDLQISKTILWLPKGKQTWRGRDEHTHTTIYKIDKQQGPTV